MRCSNCNYFNDSKAQYCKNCGSLLSTINKEPILRSATQRSTITSSEDHSTIKRSTITKSENQITINSLLLVLGTILFTTLIWFVFDILSNRLDYIIEWVTLFSYFTDGILLLVILIAFTRVTNEKARIFLIIFFLVRLLITIGYRYNNFF